MILRNLGNAIRRRRLKLGLTQQILCRSLCSQQTLSKLEGGKAMPKGAVVQAILERLGLRSENILDLLSGNDESERAEHTHELRRLLLERSFGEAKRLAEKWQTKPDFKDGLGLQFLLLVRATVARELGDTDEALRLLQEAIRITNKDFAEDNIRWLPLSNVEIEIINGFALTYDAVNQVEKAIEILCELKASIELHGGAGRERAANLVFVLCNIACFLETVRRYDDAIEICRKAKHLAVQYNCLHLYPTLTLNEIECLFQSGKPEETMRLMPLAHYGCMIIEDFDGMQALRDFVDEKYHARLEFKHNLIPHTQTDV